MEICALVGPSWLIRALARYASTRSHVTVTTPHFFFYHIIVSELKVNRVCRNYSWGSEKMKWNESNII